MNVDMRELSEKATHVAAEAWDQAHGLVSELVERGKDLDVPQRVEHVVEAIREPAQHAVETIREPAQHAVEALREPAARAATEARRRRWTLIAGIGAAIALVMFGRVWCQRRAQRRQHAHLYSGEGRTDPFGPEARYQERAVSAAS